MLIKSKESVAVGECGSVHATAADAVSLKRPGWQQRGREVPFHTRAGRPAGCLSWQQAESLPAAAGAVR